MKFKFTFWKLIFAVVMVLGGYATIMRFVYGIGAVSNLSDQFPWGIWVGFDVLCGVMLAAGGFTLTAAVHILNIKRLHPIVRPTVLTAFLGYMLVSVALLVDLGRPYRIWHPLVMRNPHSVMFEVAYCVMLYTTVLSLEFSPVILERFKLEKPSEVRQGRAYPARYSRRDPLDLASVLARHRVPHHAYKTSPLLVHPAVAGLFFHLGNRRRFGDDYL